MLTTQIDPERLVFVDEMATNISLSVLCAPGRDSDKGLILLGASQPGTEHNTAFEYEPGGNGAIACAVEGSTNHEVFEIYVERVLAPALRRGQVVVMDNLSAHKGERVRELVEQQGCKLLYLPSYSPDFNPIEEAFSKIKAFIRKAEARSHEALRSKRWELRSRQSHGSRCSRFLRALRVRYTGSTVMKNAVSTLFRTSFLREVFPEAVAGFPESLDTVFDASAGD